MIVYHKNLPPLLADFGIEVPMLKGRALRAHEELRKVLDPAQFYSGPVNPLEKDDYLRAHSQDFLRRCEADGEKVIQETFELIAADGSYHRYNPKNAKHPLKDLISAFQESTNHSFKAMEIALETGFSYFLGGGYHHAMTDKGRGFCLFNDIVIGARKLQATDPGPIWVIDIDAHKGCGTAQITEHDESIHTLSIHMRDGWPLDSGPLDASGKSYPWFIPSTIDIGIGAGEEESYLNRLSKGLSELGTYPPPKLCIVVDGSDPYEGDALPSADLLQLSKSQCLERNLLVYEFLKKKNIPQAYLMSGGYGEKNWEIHYQFIKSVLERT